VTVTSKPPDDALPLASVAVQVTRVVPTGKAEPEAGAQPTATGPSWTSAAVGSVQLTVAPEPVVVADWSPGTPLSCGPVVSTTVTTKPAEPVRPAPSVALQVTVVGPSGSRVPDAGAQAAGSSPSWMSEAVAL
jgi:hypothetical protein